MVAVTAVTPVKLVFMAMIAPTGSIPRPELFPDRVKSWVIVVGRLIVKADPVLATDTCPVVPFISLKDA